jgi:hypothetical protein
MTEKQNDISHFIITILLTYIHPNDSTEKINKLKKAIRLKLKEFAKINNNYYLQLAQEADVIWKEVSEDVKKNNTKLLLSQCLLIIYSNIEKFGYSNSWFKDRIFFDAVSSLANSKFKSKYDLSVQINAELESNYLSDLIQEKIGIMKDNRLSILRQKVDENLKKDKNE